METASSLDAPLGRITISHDAVAQIVGRVAAEAYGVVGMGPRSRVGRLLGRDKWRQGVAVTGSGDAIGHPIDPPFADPIEDVQTALVTFPAFRQRVQT